MAMYSLNGANGQLYVYEDHIEIRRDGFLAKATHLQKSSRFTYLDFSEISEIKYHPGIMVISGYLCFLSEGDKNSNLIDAARDENCIVFRSYENAHAREIYKYLKHVCK